MCHNLLLQPCNNLPVLLENKRKQNAQPIQQTSDAQLSARRCYPFFL